MLQTSSGKKQGQDEFATTSPELIPEFFKKCYFNLYSEWPQLLIYFHKNHQYFLSPLLFLPPSQIK